MWIAKRFWMAYTFACAVWLLGGFSLAGVQFTKRAMPRDAQLALHGGQCPPTGSTCSSTCNAPNGDCSKSGIMGCGKENDFCDTSSVDQNSTGLLNECGGTAGATACALSVPQAKCADVQPCRCKDNGNGGFKCVADPAFEDDEDVCIQGAEGQPT